MSAELFRKIAEANARCDGWCELEKAEALAAMVITLRPMVVVEIGVFGARSLQAFALAAQQNMVGKVIGIDPWDREASIAGMEDPKNREWWSNLDHERIYQRCLANLKQSGIEHCVEIIRKKSDDVDPSQWRIDILHIDGSHEETAYRDTVRYAAHVRVGGIVVCDDTKWSSGAPQRGVDWMLANGFIELYQLGTGAVFQRIS